MSGFVGVVNLDGSPVDAMVLWKLTRFMDFRGPDDQRIHIEGCAGFGHTLLRTTFEAESEHQPCTLDGVCWLAGDCRIDCRDELISELAARGRAAVREACDPELILHAYAVWGRECVQHLLGDFSFAIWNSLDRQLFLARDQIGVKLLYYARTPNCLIFGNTLHAIRLHPEVSGELNDLAVADFLLFGLNQDAESTSFEGIRRLPAAHCASLEGGQRGGGELKLRRYWSFPVDPPLRLRHRRDYPELFLSLFRTVVKDRLRTDRVGIQMSGGLDSTAIAAIARQLSAGSGFGLSAYTNVFNELIPDEERYFAGLAASHLGIPVRFLAGDDDKFYEDYPRQRPSADPAFIVPTGQLPASSILDIVAGDGIRVSLFGEGADNALDYEWKPYVRYEIGQRHFGSLMLDALSFPALFGQLPMWARFPRFSRRPRDTGNSVGPADQSLDEVFPSWLNADLVRRLGLRERLTQTTDHLPQTSPVRPWGYASFGDPLWQTMFEGLDSGVSEAPVEVRHPFMDIRMLRFLLSVPVIPWCRDKYLIRCAMRLLLPDEITKRPKTGVQGFPFFAIWNRQEVKPALLKSSLTELASIRKLLTHYVDLEALNRATSPSRQSIAVNLRPRALAFFLRSLTL